MPGVIQMRRLWNASCRDAGVPGIAMPSGGPRVPLRLLLVHPARAYDCARGGVVTFVGRLQRSPRMGQARLGCVRATVHL